MTSERLRRMTGLWSGAAADPQPVRSSQEEGTHESALDCDPAETCWRSDGDLGAAPADVPNWKRR